MNETAFAENFVWYEWSFVRPEDLPEDDRDLRKAASELTASPPSSEFPLPPGEVQAS